VEHLIPRERLVTAEELSAVIQRLGDEVTHCCPDASTLLVVGVLKGSFMFLADLVRHIRRAVEVDFITCSSYGPRTVSTGRVDILQDVRADVSGRSIVLVEDIIDSGRTVEKLREHFRTRGAKEVVICALFTRGRHPGVLTGIVLEDNTFVVGYGLDYQERFRELPDVWALGQCEHGLRKSGANG
jgi:hypoxanthine phosphoribosyltransferase